MAISDGQKQPLDAIGSGSKVTVGFMWALFGAMVTGGLFYVSEIKQHGHLETKVEVLTKSVDTASQTLIDIRQAVSKLADGQEAKLEKLTERVRTNEQNHLLLKAEVDRLKQGK